LHSVYENAKKSDFEFAGSLNQNEQGLRMNAFRLNAPRILIVAFAMTIAPAAFAQIPSWGVDTFQAPAEPRWGATATQDVEAAFQLLRDNHPGAAPELHDLEFQHRLKNAHTLALKRARTVTSYQGYLFVLAGFATDMGDKHIWSRPTFVVNLPRWAGIIVSKRGDAWIVTDTESAQSTVLGAFLISCDGVAVQDLARKNIGGFHAVWSVGAQQIQNAPWLLVDEGNPFISRPKACVFEHNSQRETVTLDWVRIKRENLLPRMKKAIGAGAAGFGVRRVGQGYWIALQDLRSDEARAVVQAVEDQKTALREVPYVVLDLRGNGGGSSVMGRQIAASLLGAAAADERLGSATEAACGGPDGSWRASEGNIRQLEFVLASPLVTQGGPEIRKMMQDTMRDARAALAQGKAFSATIDCPIEVAKPPAATQAPSLMKGRLILLTDSLCFSSCLSVTGDFLTLGAFHVGQTTDAATRFVDVREQYLPSGYSMFSTLESVDPSSPSEVGPFDPVLTYNGDIADTDALEKWVVAVAVPAATRGT
jgi:Peptidase family S41